ncbi:MAG: ABC transporter ATP-binding protein [Chloroflexaceae bacterium]
MAVQTQPGPRVTHLPPAKQPRRPTVIDVEDVDFTFTRETGVFDLTFQVPAGTIFGLIGPSGCGKTTTVRLLNGLYRPDQGSVRVLDQRKNRFTTRTRERIGYMPQQFVLYPNLTVGENLNFVASLYGLGYMNRRKQLRQLLEFVELADVRNRLAGKLSGGMQRRLLLACSLVHNPVLLFADEPTVGIDPVLRAKFWDSFHTLRDQGHTLFITTQYVSEAAYCDLVGVMRAGRLIYFDTPEGLRRQAMQGEIIKLTVTPERIMDAARLIYPHPEVNEIRQDHTQPGMLYVYVTSAAEMIPTLVTLLGDHPEITVEQAEEYQLPFDDIFIALMEKADQAYA